MRNITEQPSIHRHLEEKSIAEITTLINKEDTTVAHAIATALPQVNGLIGAIVEKLKQGGRMFYVGAGSGGRLSVLDVIDCLPPMVSAIVQVLPHSFQKVSPIPHTRIWW